MPSARLRSRPSRNVVIRSERPAGAKSAPPRPWIARKTTRARAAQRAWRSGNGTAELSIYPLLLSWNDPTISQDHTGTRYTSPVKAIIENPVVKPGVKPPYELVCSTTHLLKRLGMKLKD